MIWDLKKIYRTRIFQKSKLYNDKMNMQYKSK